jgi:hypothetical protein
MKLNNIMKMDVEENRRSKGTGSGLGVSNFGIEAIHNIKTNKKIEDNT